MKTYFRFVSQTDKSQLDLWFNGMSEEKKAAVLKLKRAETANQRIVADALARNALSEIGGIKPDEIIFSENEFGKPYAENVDAHFSVSHSGDAVICAVSERPVGIDIEKIRDVRFKTAERFATAQELEYIGENTERFFEIWTLKEAYFKCIGTGLDASIKDVSFKISGNEIECSEKGYEFKFLKAADGYCCSICEKTRGCFTKRRTKETE